jgi:hypothetical protein
MVDLAPSSENEMVLAFLRADIDAPRYRDHYAEALQGFRRSRTDLIDDADPSSDSDNLGRLRVLRGVRGVAANTMLFPGIPNSETMMFVEGVRAVVKRVKAGDNFADVLAVRDSRPSDTVTSRGPYKRNGLRDRTEANRSASADKNLVAHARMAAHMNFQVPTGPSPRAGQRLADAGRIALEE